MRVERLSRHLYDIFKLSQSPYAEKAFSNPELYQTIVEHRHKFNRIGHIDYNLHQPESINILPPEQVMSNWNADYKTMLEQMIYEKNPPLFDELLKGLIDLKNKINSLGWKFNFNF